MKKRIFSSLAVLFFGGALMIACDNSDELGLGTDSEEETAIESSSVGDDASDDVLEVSYQAEKDLTSSGGRRASNICGEITKDEVNKVITIDFGDGCVGPHGNTRKGKILISYSSEIGDSVANRIITFENYFINNKGITGKIELRDFSINEAGNLVSTKRVTDLKVTFPNGEYFTFNGTRTREWLSGRGDNDPSNNVYKITGTLTGKSSKGRSFTEEIVEPIISDWSCAAEGNFARIQGIVQLTKLTGFGSRTRTVDYGDGTCDNVITITTAKRTYSVTLD